MTSQSFAVANGRRQSREYLIRLCWVSRRTSIALKTFLLISLEQVEEDEPADPRCPQKMAITEVGLVGFHYFLLWFHKINQALVIESRPAVRI